jgi:hypothetical protein
MTLVTQLTRARQFHGTVTRHVNELAPAEGERFLASFQCGLLSLEHAISAAALIDIGHFASAFALYRPQFESLVRGIWLLHAASDGWVNKLSAPLTIESAKKANEGLGMADMLTALESSEAPEHIVKQLQLYRDVTWKALNSFTHVGIHPIARTAEGYPEQLVIDSLRNSNALVSLASQLLAISSGDPDNMIPVRRFHVEFADCLPIVSA